ncbi:MAG: hypothetical protein EU542_04830 [Promethearchaeota archaeon]|nr:MAG: hypothetical protein EU542_04830 [Candidatus Lokiarchaeota archaeon]
MVEDTIRIHSKKINRIFQITGKKWITKCIYGSDFNFINCEESKEFCLEIQTENEIFQLDNRDFLVSKFKIMNKKKGLELKVILKARALKNVSLEISYVLDSSSEVLLKQLMITNLTKKTLTLLGVIGEFLTFKSIHKQNLIAQPVLTSGFFWFINHPSARNQHDGKHLKLWYELNQKLNPDDTYQSEIAIIGALHSLDKISENLPKF